MIVDHTVLLVTAGIELGLAAGYGLRIAHDWIRECRLMVLHALASITRGGRA